MVNSESIEMTILLHYMNGQQVKNRIKNEFIKEKILELV